MSQLRFRDLRAYGTGTYIHFNWKVYVFDYLDNIIANGTGFYPALDHLKMVWTRICEANLDQAETCQLTAA